MCIFKAKSKWHFQNTLNDFKKLKVECDVVSSTEEEAVFVLVKCQITSHASVFTFAFSGMLTFLCPNIGLVF